MSINSELTRLDAVRDALVSSVNEKGGNLAADATLWQVKAAIDGIEVGGGEDPTPIVTQPKPTVSVNSSNGLVTAKYTPVAGKVTDTTEKSGTLQLTAQAAQTITPGTTDKTIASGRYLTGTQTIKGDSNLTAGNIKKGVSIFNISGEYEGEGGGGAGAFDLVAITSYTPAYANITSMQLSGMGMDEMSGSDFSAANGTYTVTNDTASLPADKKVFKHNSANYYVVYLPESTDGMYYSYGWCLASSASVSNPWGAYMIGPKDLVAGTSYWQDEMGMTYQSVTVSNIQSTEVPAAVSAVAVTGYAFDTLLFDIDYDTPVAISSYDYEPEVHGIYALNGTRLVGKPIGNEGGAHLRMYIPWRGDVPFGKMYPPRGGDFYESYATAWKYPSLQIYNDQTQYYQNYVIDGVQCVGVLNGGVRMYSTTDWNMPVKTDYKLSPVPLDANRKWSAGAAFNRGGNTTTQRMLYVSVSNVATISVDAKWVESTPRIVVYKDDTEVITYTNSGLKTGWHHVILTYDYDIKLFVLYVDGVKCGEYSFSFERARNYDTIVFGCGHHQGDGAYMIGYLCEIKFWDTPLTATQAMAEYNRAINS